MLTHHLMQTIVRIRAIGRTTTVGFRCGVLTMICLVCFLYVTQDLARVYHFWGDQGTTAHVLRAMYETGELPLLGPEAGFGARYLGPAYYAILYPAFRLSDFNPLAGGYSTAAINLVAIALLLFHVSARSRQILLPGICLITFSMTPQVFEALRTNGNVNLLPATFCLFLLAALRHSESSRYPNVWTAVLSLLLGIGMQLHMSAFPLVPLLGSALVLVAVRHRLGVRAYAAMAATTIGMILIVFLPALMQGTSDGFQDIRQFLSFVAGDRPVASGRHVGLSGMIKLCFDPWQWTFGSIAGALFYALLLPVAGIVVVTDRARTARSLLLILLTVAFASFIVSLSSYSGDLYAYYLTPLLPIPVITAAVLPWVTDHPRLRMVLTLAVAMVLLLQLPGFHRSNTQYLKGLDSSTDFQSTLRISERIASLAQGRQFGVHFQDRGHTDPDHYLFCFDTLSRTRGEQVRARRIHGVQIFPPNFLIVN